MIEKRSLVDLEAQIIAALLLSDALGLYDASIALNSALTLLGEDGLLPGHGFPFDDAEIRVACDAERRRQLG